MYVNFWPHLYKPSIHLSIQIDKSLPFLGGFQTRTFAQQSSFETLTDNTLNQGLSLAISLAHLEVSKFMSMRPRMPSGIYSTKEHTVLIQPFAPNSLLETFRCSRKTNT